MRKNGFTLIEMLIAVVISWMIMLAVMALFTPVMGTQFKLAKTQRIQGDALVGLRGLQNDLKQASDVSRPPSLAADSPDDVLSACSNYDERLGAGASGVLDSSSPNRSFYYCVNAGGDLLRYEASGTPTACPIAAPACGTGSPLLLASNVTHSPGHAKYFLRPAGAQNVVEVHFTVAKNGLSQDVDTAFAVQGTP